MDNTRSTPLVNQAQSDWAGHWRIVVAWSKTARSGWRNWVRTSEEVPEKGASEMAIKIILGTSDQSKLIRDLLRLHGVFSLSEPSANPALFDLPIASPATPNTRRNGFTPFVS